MLRFPDLQVQVQLERDGAWNLFHPVLRGNGRHVQRVGPGSEHGELAAPKGLRKLVYERALAHLYLHSRSRPRYWPQTGS